MTINVLQPDALPHARVSHTSALPLAGVGVASCSVFAGLVDGRTDHVALLFPPHVTDTPLVRVHSECVTGDVFGSLRCDCGPQLQEALHRCSAEGGILLYLRQEGRGIGLSDKIAAYGLQDKGLDTFTANLALGHAEDERDYRVAAQMLEALGVRRIRLLSNNPEKKHQLERHGIAVVAWEPTGVHLTLQNARYLADKRDHAGHRFAADAFSAVAVKP